MRWSADGQTLLADDGKAYHRPGWSPDPAVIQERDNLHRNSFFLLRIAGNDGVGEVWRCKRCRGRHSYMTASCIERPFNGLDQVVHALYQQAGDLAAVESVGPNGRQTIKQALLREIADVPDLSTMHPHMARQQAAQTHLTAFSIEIGGVPLGRVEEIPRTFAQRLLDKINANRPADGKLAVEGLEVH